MSNSPLKFQVLLSPDQRAELSAIARQTSAGVAKVRRAKILLLADQAHPEGGFSDREISEQVGLCTRQIVRIRQKFVHTGTHPTLARALRSDAGVQRAIDGRAEAQLITVACSMPPEGSDHWTLQMLCNELQRLQIVKSVCCETVRQVLKKTNCGPGRRSVSVSPKQTARGSSRGWKKSSTSTKQPTTNGTR